MLPGCIICGHFSENNNSSGLFDLLYPKLSTFFTSPNEVEENDIFASKYVVMDESHLPLRHLAKEHLQLARKETFFYEIDKGTVRLFDSRLQLSKRTLCKILSNC